MPGIYLATDLDTSVDPFEGTVLEVPIRETRFNPRNVFSVYVWAVSFGGKTVVLQVSPDYDETNPSLADWFTARRQDETQASWTISDVYTVILRGKAMRIRVTGAGTTDNLNMVIY